MNVPPLPLLSLGLLWLIHLVFGWLLGEATNFWLHWGLAVCFIILLALVFTAPSSMVRTSVYRSFRSDFRAFLSVLLSAIAVVIMVTWFTQVVRLVVLLAAGALARLELHSADYGEWQSFTLVMLVSVAGFATGLGAQYYFQAGAVP